MRVIAGEFRGRRLVSPPADADVRPTSDRAREAVFSILGDVTGLQVLDLFSGTGALGIEALSRGAQHATFVDTDTRAAAANVEALDLPKDRAEVVRSDAIRFLEHTAGGFDLILCDPPWDRAISLAPALASALPRRVADGGRVVLEGRGGTPMPLDLIGFRLERERRYGESLMRIWRKSHE